MQPTRHTRVAIGAGLLAFALSALLLLFETESLAARLIHYVGLYVVCGVAIPWGYTLLVEREKPAALGLRRERWAVSLVLSLVLAGLSLPLLLLEGDLGAVNAGQLGRAVHDPHLYRDDGGRRWIEVSQRDPHLSLFLDVQEPKRYVPGDGGQVIFRCSEALACSIADDWRLPPSASDLIELPTDTAVARLAGMVVTLKVASFRPILQATAHPGRALVGRPHRL